MVAQLGVPDMRIPIAYALSYPERLELGLSRLNLAQCGELTFEQPDLGRFPALRLAFEALAQGGVKPAALNAANEVAVEAFLDGRIGFTRIAEVVEKATRRADSIQHPDLEAILAADRQARLAAGQEIQRC